MIFRAVREFKLSLSSSILIGDKPSDIYAARASGIGKAYIIDSDNSESRPGISLADASYPDLYSCVVDFLRPPVLSVPLNQRP
jgi:D-glycero-D-manno-heptose 1,7-bisphosphate phosphatase